MARSAHCLRGAGYPLAALALWLLSTAALAQASTALSGHRIGPGDILNIRVFGEDDLSPRIKVDGDGSIPYNFLGELSVAGLTTNEVEALIVDGLKGPYLVNPRVAVSVAEYRPVYVYGEVRSPGGYPFEPGLTVRKAVSLAGGMTDRASARKIFLLREGASSDNERVRAELDTRLAAGDTITIEESFF